MRIAQAHLQFPDCKVDIATMRSQTITFNYTFPSCWQKDMNFRGTRVGIGRISISYTQIVVSSNKSKIVIYSKKRLFKEFAWNDLTKFHTVHCLGGLTEVNCKKINPFSA